MSSTSSISGSSSISSDFYSSMFKKIDSDSDGSVSKSEFEKFQSEIGMSTSDADNLFSEVDTDGDGSISATENETYMKNHKPSGPPPPPPPSDSSSTSSTQSSTGISLTDLFSQTDTDGDGVLSEEEQQAYMQKIQDAFKQLTSSQGTYTSQGQAATTTTQVIDTEA